MVCFGCCCSCCYFVVGAGRVLPCPGAFLFDPQNRIWDFTAEQSAEFGLIAVFYQLEADFVQLNVPRCAYAVTQMSHFQLGCPTLDYVASSPLFFFAYWRRPLRRLKEAPPFGLSNFLDCFIQLFGSLLARCMPTCQRKYAKLTRRK